MMWNDSYPEQNHIRKEVDDKLDIKQCFTNQKSADIDQIIQSVRF